LSKNAQRKGGEKVKSLEKRPPKKKDRGEEMCSKKEEKGVAVGRKISMPRSQLQQKIETKTRRKMNEEGP